MKPDHGDTKPEDNAYDREIVIKQVVVLGIIVFWLIASAFLFSGCSDSQRSDDSFDSTMAETSVPRFSTGQALRGS